MHLSPMHREISVLLGDGDQIASRGRAIESLGEQMQESASILLAVKDSDDGQYGQAVDRLREEIGDAYEKLQEAGELYTPVGPRITEYGEQVSELQPRIREAVQNCIDLWATYESLPGSMYGPDSGADDPAEAEQEYATKVGAWNAWNEAAGDYDVLVSTWEVAYDQAAAGIGDDMAGKIRDPSWWRDALNWVSNALGWAALVVGIVALIAGGPFVALAALLGAAIFAVTAIQYIVGEASLSEMAWATVGIIPFGKVGMLFRGNKAGFAGEMFKGFTKTNFMKMTSGTADVLHRVQGAQGFWRSVGASIDGGLSGSLSRILTGKDPHRWEKMVNELDLDNPAIRVQLGNAADATWQTMTTMTGHMANFDSWIAKIGGYDPLMDTMPVPIRVAF